MVLIYKLIVSDRQFNIKEEIQDIASNIRWDYNRIGGCGACSFDVPIRFCEETQLGGSFNIRIERFNPSTKAFDLWYQGRIEDKIPNVRGHSEVMTIRGFGYQSELKDIYISATYTSKTIEFIVDAILDLVTPFTNITKGTISATGFTADSLTFNTDALSAIQTCADIVGTREWGVDSARNFTFQARDTSVGFRFPLGAKATNFSATTSSKDIINRVIVIGGETGGSTFTRTANDVTSQNKWKRRDKAITNSAITTNAVADQFADAVFAEFSDVVRRARITLLDEQQIETTLPIPLVQVLPTKTITYGTQKYGTFLYQGKPKYQVQRVSYSLDNNTNLTIDITLGQPRPDITENISQLKFQLDQLSSRGI